MVCINMDITKTVTIPYDPAWEALAWAKDNCASYITNSSAENPESFGSFYDRYIIYYFSDEKDATMFRLRWM